jgi:hypothetical protein
VEDKEDQIPKIHLTYEIAAFTIIAAAGDNASAGLPGVKSASRELS